MRDITIECLGDITHILLHSFTGFDLQIHANVLHLSMPTSIIMHKTIA